ncbi:MAG: MFS transporter [Caulobacteraceae bacterium]
MNSYRIAWLFALLFYFLEYLARSAPAVMVSDLRDAFHLQAVQVSGVIGSYYYTYSISSLIAGALLDRFGAKYPAPSGLALLSLGCLLFAGPNAGSAEFGRLMQGAGSAFAFTSAIYLASRGFSSRAQATAVGVTQCLGMFGGWIGQVGVGPLTHGVIDWRLFWIGLAAACGVLVVMLFVATPVDDEKAAKLSKGTMHLLRPFAVVFSNLQSYLCGLVAGLLFVPTTVGIMIWGVSFFQLDRGYAYGLAVMTVGMTPLGWVIGCPLLGWLSDRLRRRKPVILLGAGTMLASVLVVAWSRNLVIDGAALFAAGIGSGAAMIPYSIIKEVNPDEVKGSATGVMNFLTFGISAAIGPIFAHSVGAALATTTDRLAHFKAGAGFWCVAIAIAMAATLALRETGGAAQTTSASTPRGAS